MSTTKPMDPRETIGGVVAPSDPDHSNAPRPTTASATSSTSTREYQDASLQQLQDRVNSVYHRPPPPRTPAASSSSSSITAAAVTPALSLQAPVSYTPNQTITSSTTANMTITADGDQSYDYYMEGGQGKNATPQKRHPPGSMLMVAGHPHSSMNGNHGNANDTFEDLWQDELEGSNNGNNNNNRNHNNNTNQDGLNNTSHILDQDDTQTFVDDDDDDDDTMTDLEDDDTGTIGTRFSTGTANTGFTPAGSLAGHNNNNNTQATTDDASLCRMSIQRMIWKANAVQAALVQQEEQQEQQVFRPRPPIPHVTPQQQKQQQKTFPVPARTNSPSNNTNQSSSPEQRNPARAAGHQQWLSPSHKMDSPVVLNPSQNNSNGAAAEELIMEEPPNSSNLSIISSATPSAADLIASAWENYTTPPSGVAAAEGSSSSSKGKSGHSKAAAVANTENDSLVDHNTDINNRSITSELGVFKAMGNPTTDTANNNLPLQERTNQSQPPASSMKSPPALMPLPSSAYQQQQQHRRTRTPDPISAAEISDIQRSLSSPPDPPSHQFVSTTTKQTSLNHNHNTNHQAKGKFQVPNAVQGGKYYDPEEDDGTLTNLVITVVGLDGSDDAPNTTTDQQLRKELPPPSFVEDDDEDETTFDPAQQQQEAFHDEATDISFVSRFDVDRDLEEEQQARLVGGRRRGTLDESMDVSVSHTRPVPYSFQTLFLTADAASGIFFATFLLLWVPLALMGMILWELLDMKSNPITSWRSFLGVPMNEDLSVAVRVTQISLLLGWVLLVKQMALVDTTIQCLCLLTRRRSSRHNRQAQQAHQQQVRNNGNKYANMSYLQRSVMSISSSSGTTSISKGRWLLGSTLEWMKHVLYMINAVVILLQATDSVMLLLYNMAALEFVSRLDAMAFHVWTRGKIHFSPTMLSDRDASYSNALATPTTIPHTNSSPLAVSTSQKTASQSGPTFTRSSPHAFPEHAEKQPILRIFLFFLISASILLAFGCVAYEQVLGSPAVSDCGAILLQFGELVDDDFATTGGTSYYLATIFSGIYKRRVGKLTRHHGRFIYDLSNTSRTELTTNYKVAYCRSLEAWTVSIANRNPCEEYLVRTGPTRSYDLLSLQGDELGTSVTWFVSSREESDSISHDAPLDWFQASCAECTPNTSEESYGYHCTQRTFQMAAFEQEPLVMATPCTTLTWDTRSTPFPDVLAKLRASSNDDESAAIMGGVDPNSQFSIMVDRFGSVMLDPQYQRPVYAAQFESQLVLMTFVGRRWMVALMRSTFEEWENHPERHLDKLSILRMYLEESSTAPQTTSASSKVYPMFVSNSIAMAGSEDLSPVGLGWNTVRKDDAGMSGTSLLPGEPLETTLLCSVCNESTNPCHSGGYCYQPSSSSESAETRSQCICRPGYEGYLCESSPLGCEKGKLGLCYHNGLCVDGACECPTWERNRKSHQIRGDVCQVLPNCFDFELDGIGCFEKGSCSNVGCDNGGICNSNGSCDCDGSSTAEAGKFRGKLCQERVNCFEYEAEGQDCISKGTCSNKVCNGGVCGADGSCKSCPDLAQGRFCQVLPDCFDAEIGGAESSCFETGRCSNAGCANGGTCQRDGSCGCSSARIPDKKADVDPFDDAFEIVDDDTLTTGSSSSSSNKGFSGKLCQLVNKPEKPIAGTSTLQSNTPIGPSAIASINTCELSGCVVNGGKCTADGRKCVCPEGLSGEDCSLPLDCWANEIGEQDCVAAGTCTNSACHSRSSNSTCLADGNCECPAMYDVELYGKLCHKVWPIDDCFAPEADGKDCLKLGTCSHGGCSNGGKCTEDGSCDCPSLFWGKVSLSCALSIVVLSF